MKAFSFENIILFLAGAAITIVVSFIFFRLQENRAMTARKERIDRANTEVIRNYVKMILQFESNIRAADLQTLDLSVAKEFGVNRAELLGAQDMFETAIGFILQSDFIRREEKELIISSQKLPELRESLRNSVVPPKDLNSSDASFNVAAPIALVVSSGVALLAGYYMYHAADIKNVVGTASVALASLFVFFFSFVIVAIVVSEYWLSKVLAGTKAKVPTRTQRPRRNIIDADFKEVSDEQGRSEN